MYNALFVMWRGFVCVGRGLGFSSRLVEIHFGIFSFHFSYPQLEISPVIVFPEEIHQAFAAIQDMIWLVPGASWKIFSLLRALIIMLNLRD